MPVPIQPVTSFSESELWYMYQQLTEINANTSGGGGGLSQTEVYEIFNGTNPQGFAVSLFESLSGSDTSLADLTYNSYLKLSSINTNTGNAATTLNNIDGTTQTIEGYSQNIQNNTSTANTKLTSIDTKLTNVATTTLQTTGNNSLSSIDTKLTNVATTTLQTTGNASLSSIDTKLTNVATTTLQTTGNNSLSSIDTKLTTETTNTTNIATYLSTVRNAVLTSTTGSLTVAPAVHNISIYNSGAAAGTINVSSGGPISIPSGITVNFDAGGNNNRYAANTFVLNATGTTFIVSYTS